MGRPKGSKNVEQRKITKADALPPVPINQSPKEEVWKPSPVLKEEKKQEKCAFCFHVGEIHYGGKKNWCNVAGCNCQEFQ